MKKIYILILALLAFSMNYAQSPDRKTSSELKPRITFVELGSVRCIPCKQMQPVMKSVEKKYGGQIKVVFYDVWKEDQKKYGRQYGIKLIPTQVFLDETGKEILRHEGFFAEKEIDKFLQSKGLKVLN
ncbi:MAG: TlpA family protein disulfide reductase [Acidobacteriota bacterium]